MKRLLLIALVTAGVGTSAAVMAGALLDGGDAVIERAALPGPQPDTSSPRWKALSDDVGVMIRNDERLGLRGRLYVRVNGAWLPVATDGLADVLRTVPVR